MKREYLNVLTSTSKNADAKPIQPAQSTPSILEKLGGQPFFAQQISINDLESLPPVRVMEVQRRGLHVMGDGIKTHLPPNADITVGDWLFLDPARPNDPVLLERKSLIKRRAPRHDRKIQLIAANIDTVFIITSCNPDFNIARLERYIALALEAEVTPVIVLTKADMCEYSDPYRSQAEAISDTFEVVLLDARGSEPQSKLAPWCRPGQMVALLGSSGVGKSTLTNALSGTTSIETSRSARTTQEAGIRLQVVSFICWPMAVLYSTRRACVSCS